MDRPWIDIRELPELRPGMKLALFGAGQGSVELLDHFAECGADVSVLAVADNDPTTHGKEFHSIPVVAPDTLPGGDFDAVIVTTVSGRAPVSAQLEAMGMVRGRDFFLVGTYPVNLNTLRTFLRLHTAMHLARPGMRAGHVGPGGFLGFECALKCLFDMDVTGVDAYDFAVAYPDVTASRDRYAFAGEKVAAIAGEYGMDAAACGRCWAGLFEERGDRLFIDEQAVDFRFPHRYSALPFDDGELDLLCSFAVLEHVCDPEAALRETLRCLSPGGVALSTALTTDHRSYGTLSGYSPISYRYHSCDEWERINRDKFHQNRIAPFQWKELFEGAGLEVELFEVHQHYELAPGERDKLHPDFRHWPDHLQGQVDCTIVARKPE